MPVTVTLTTFYTRPSSLEEVDLDFFGQARWDFDPAGPLWGGPEIRTSTPDQFTLTYAPSGGTAVAAIITASGLPAPLASAFNIGDYDAWLTAAGSAEVEAINIRAGNGATYIADIRFDGVEGPTVRELVTSWSEADLVALGPIVNGERVSVPGIEWIGGGGANERAGTARDDVLDGRGGNDVLRGLGGDDDLAGGRGGDVLRGGDGDDTLSGGRGNDRLFGGAGQDTIEGGAGRDVIDGGAGDDVLDGGAGNDRVLGGRGADTITGGGGNDRLLGGAGQDTIEGAGRSVIQGGRGDDRLTGSEEARLFGGGGDDTLIGGGDVVMMGGRGADSFEVGPGGTARGGAGADTLMAQNAFSSTAEGVRLVGGNGNDQLFGGGGADELIGGAGDDTIYGNGAQGSLTFVEDRAVGGAGNDTYFSVKTVAFGTDRFGDDRYEFREANRPSIELRLEGWVDEFDLAGLSKDEQMARAGVTVEATESGLFERGENFLVTFGDRGTLDIREVLFLGTSTAETQLQHIEDWIVFA